MLIELRHKRRLMMRYLKISTLVFLAGFPVVLASVPRSADISNDVAIYQNLHEIKVTKTKYLNFDGDIRALSAQEKHPKYQMLPSRISDPMERINKTQYRPGKYRQKTESTKRFHRE